MGKIDIIRKVSNIEADGVTFIARNVTKVKYHVAKIKITFVSWESDGKEVLEKFENDFNIDSHQYDKNKYTFTIKYNFLENEFDRRCLDSVEDIIFSNCVEIKSGNDFIIYPKNIKITICKNEYLKSVKYLRKSKIENICKKV